MTKPKLLANFALYFILTYLFTACKPDTGSYVDDPTPDFTGTYNIVSVTAESATAPLPTPTGTIVIVKIWGYTSVVSFNLNLKGEKNLAGEVNLRKTNGNAYDMYVGESVRYGSIDGTEVTLNYMKNNVRYIVTATR